MLGSGLQYEEGPGSRAMLGMAERGVEGGNEGCKGLGDRLSEEAENGLSGGRGKKKTTLRERTKGVKDWAVGCLKKPTRGDRKGEGRKKIMLRVIELSSVFTPRPSARMGEPPRFHLGSVKVEECEVWEVDSEDL